ncbi:MAG: ATP-binding protein [Acidimicrobiaceae bacterium]|nr:ATP-binding protein [Acidimicrobiaceae bacterium]MXW62939.1 ATP-binding protein [Acidimicrobiaceae bacterium]MXW76985.1 ATP-binding protein [Acidimicrobiaceae bacterium]MYA74291.1 ATP-binding protein [Acidimicrobiaceae bacterium]MYC41653.1 ATP-binding protein [Acidimicrobiaceae bacterium]
MEQRATARNLTTFDVDGLADFAGHLREAERSGSTCVLDVSDQAVAGSASPSAVRLSIPSVMVISNLLMGRFRNVPVALRVPQSRSINLQLARGGFFFALANRSGVIWDEQQPEEWSRTAKDWVNPFHPSDERMRREVLVDVKDPETDSWVVRAAFQRYLLSVMHPHNRPARHLRRDLRQIAGRWLSSRLHVTPGSDMVSTLHDCLEVFYQIVVNVPDHASLRSQEDGCSLGQVYATLGGGRDSHNRLHFTVLDNGLGIPRRVRSIYKDRERTAEDALGDAVMGRLPRPPGGRGIGLDLVRRIASEYTEGLRGVGGASSIRIVTNGDTEGSASHLEWNPDSETPETSSVEGLPVQGTLVWVTLGLEHRIPGQRSHQLELTFTEPIVR